MQRRRFQQSLNVGFCEAVSDLALISGWGLFVFSLSASQEAPYHGKGGRPALFGPKR